MLKRDAFDAERFLRRRSQTVFGHSIFMPSPEDVILSKLLWYKEAQTDKHFNDARGVWDMQRQTLDLNYLHIWANKLSVKNILERLENSDE
jgi:hypothetical protein